MSSYCPKCNGTVTLDSDFGDLVNPKNASVSCPHCGEIFKKSAAYPISTNLGVEGSEDKELGDPNEGFGTWRTPASLESSFSKKLIVLSLIVLILVFCFMLLNSS